MARAAMARALSRQAYDLVIFDLDGVVTRTAEVHAAAWKDMFDDFLRRRAVGGGAPFQPFDIATDYLRYVDGKPRSAGVRSFLESRGVQIPEGEPDDPPDRETICGLGHRKNQRFAELLKQRGVRPYETTVALIRALRQEGMATAVVSSSKNCAAVLEAAGLTGLFDARVDGVEADRLNLPGKPAPDLFLEAARRLGVKPRWAVVVEDAVVGVEAGRRGGFGLVVGVDRLADPDRLAAAGADLVVGDLSELSAEDGTPATVDTHELPSALDRLDEFRARLTGKRLAVFLDYDGTLTPIVERPEDAALPEATREVLRRLAVRCPVAVVSGRDLADVRERVALDGIAYAGSHGFDILGPDGMPAGPPMAGTFLPALDAVERSLLRDLGKIDGAQVERKKFSVAVHYRRVRDDEVARVRAVVERVLARHPELRTSAGKKVLEVQPDLAWDKGEAVRWLLGALGLNRPDVVPLYIGDDLTDEDAFEVLAGRGIGIVVRGERRRTAARYALANPEEVRRLLETLAARDEGVNG